MSLRMITGSMILLTLIMVVTPSHATTAATYQCKPTAEDEMGPFYHPDSELRNKVGKGYLLQGKVRSARDCSLIPAAKIELWMTGPQGSYGDKWRATLLSSENGTYYFESHAPTDFGTRRPHIHIRVTAAGFKPLVTQHYPLKDAGLGIFDLVLIPTEQ